MGKVLSAVERLEQFPESGRYPPELNTPSRYREVVVNPCRIFYRFEGGKIFIVHVMRSEQLLRNYMLDERS